MTSFSPLPVAELGSNSKMYQIQQIQGKPVHPSTGGTPVVEFGFVAESKFPTVAGGGEGGQELGAAVQV